MSVQETSLEVYFGEVVPTLGKRQREVLTAFTKREEFTNAELAQFLQWPINTITPRTNELVKSNFLLESRKKICNVTGRKVIAWKINSNRQRSGNCCASIGLFNTHSRGCINFTNPREKKATEQIKQPTLL